MIDKKISLGTLITIGTIIGTFIFTQGATSNRLESIEKEVSSHSIKTNKNIEKIQELEISVAKIETKIDEGFKNLENFLLENY